jgi:hypothetical protein
MLYRPLVDESPVIPSLEELSSRSEHMPEKTGSHEAPAASAVVITSVAVAQTEVAAAAPASNQRFLLKSCCFCCSLANGVFAIAFIESLAWFATLTGAIVAIYLKTQEKSIDQSIQEKDAAAAAVADPNAPMSDDAESTDQKIDQVNARIDSAAIASPFLIVMAVIGIAMCMQGFKASKGCPVGARRYYQWRRFLMVWSAVELLFGLGGGGALGVVVAVYFALVVRSHWIAVEGPVPAPVPEAEAAETAHVVIVRTSA